MGPVKVKEGAILLLLAPVMLATVFPLLVILWATLDAAMQVFTRIVR